MKKIVLLFVFFTTYTFAQKNLKELLQKYNTHSIPYISVDSLQNSMHEFILLDTREKKEFKVSHLKDALFVGYEKFNLKKIMQSIPNKNSRIVLYCSLGVRSEDIAEKLKKVGYTNIYNLYGGIFEWKNRNNKVFDTKNKETKKVHAYSKEWSQWLLKGEKVYE